MYTCHRSGYFSSKSKGLRHIKLAGSCKINSYCPAFISVKNCKETGQLHVKYFPTHVGHVFEVKHLRLCDKEKEKIAGQLITGVKISNILNNIAGTSSPTKRLAAWIHEMSALDPNPILMYKLPGEGSSEFPDLEKEDFILGFMNEAQEELFKIYGNEVLCIDSTHGTNKYNIQLTSLLIKDDNWEGFPVAFLWSNRQHETVFKYFFQKVKARVGDIKVNAFMSDDYKAFYNTWCAIFSKPNFYVLCDWHIKRALKKSLTSGATKVVNEKIPEILNRLYELINETDEATFKTLLNIFVSKILSDADTYNFGYYFIKNYCNRTEQWAACYRIDAKINTNMTVERWHKDLKYNSDLQGKCGGRLDKAIHSLLKNLRLKAVNFQV
ncbi:uncharacterized protein LOC129975328 [Argiope bruennichi]|uniref:uncharacterized protein LOC129975328 n=1 Tax=Argiope bruennichi TaxID=94029 RepID=UPI0024946F90|nr:uncharacterized protein LOC129975328 [Argiope bruennichi]